MRKVVATLIAGLGIAGCGSDDTVPVGEGNPTSPFDGGRIIDAGHADTSTVSNEGGSLDSSRPPALSATPSNLDFGSVELQGTKVAGLTVTNTGDGTTGTLAAPTTTGSQEFVAQGGGCNNGATALDAGQSCALSYELDCRTASGATAGAKSATVAQTAPAGTTSAKLLGTCVCASGDGACTTGTDCCSGTCTGGACKPITYLSITPTITPLSETSVRITWSAPTAAVNRYDVFVSNAAKAEPQITGTPVLKLAPGATTATLANLAPGTLERVIVGASVANVVGDAGAPVPSALLWTPFGAVNEDSVSSVTPLSGYPSDAYSEATFVSANFSMFYASPYLPEASFVFPGPPSSSIARPTYNFASPVVSYPSGFVTSTLSDIDQIWSDGISKVLISNNYQNRVLVYNHLPLGPETAAPDLILGQTTFTGNSANNGASAANAKGVSQAAGACFNGTTLYIRDNINNRILGYHGWPTQMGQAADFVLGQRDLVSNATNSGGISKATFNFGGDGGASLDCRGNSLAVADSGNHRVLIWKVAPTTNFVAADIVLGQANGTASAALGAGGVAAGGLMSPQSAAMLDNGAGGTAIVVTDAAANRVVAWNTIPDVDGAPFDRVFGQPDKTTTTANTGGMSMSSLSAPLFVSVDHENRFWVSDFNNCRALRFALNNPTAIDLFGQRTGQSREQLAGSYSPTRFGWLHFRQGTFGLDPASGLFVPSFGRFWNEAPANGNVGLSAVQGQPDRTSSVAPNVVSPTSVSAGGSAVMVGTRVYWSDAKRILSKVGKFTGDNAVPDIVLGNQDTAGKVVAPTTLDYAIDPTLLATDGLALLAVDGSRIVGWNPAPAASNARIGFALGQPDVTTNAANQGGVSGSSLGGGRNTMTIAGGKLVVADPANNRVLIWNAIPNTSSVAADVVLGQPNFAVSAAGSDLAGMNAPGSATVLNGKLVVSDVGNSRLLVWNTVPLVSGAPADQEWDPRTASFSLPSWFNPQALAPHDLGSYQGRLYVGQTGRVLVMPDIFIP